MPPGAHSTAVEFSCRQRRQLLDQGVRRHLRRRGQLHPLSGAPGHGAGLGRWPARTDDSITGATLTFGTAPANGAAIVAWDIGGGAPYDIGFYFPGQPEAGATLLQLVASRAFTLPVDLNGSQGYAGTAPTAQADLDLRKNGASIGTITFGSGASAGTFATAGGGARPSRRATASRSSTRTRRMPRLADLSITFLGKRT